MAESAASALVKLIFEKLADEALKKYVRSQGIHSDLENLGRELSQIQAVLLDASEKEIKGKAVKQWLNDLQHLAYDIDDILDDVATEAMRRELTQESGASTSCKVRNLIPNCCTKFSLSHRLSPKLDSITTRLHHLYKAKSDLGLVVKDQKQKDSIRGNETSLLESDVVGREGEKEKLLNKLLADESSKENFSILPIVGMGGVGKTTIARLLYNDTQVKDHFELQAWVCVSDEFDISKISKKIFQDVSAETKEFEDLNQLQMALKEKLKGKRFLLVLDDVWTENYEKWENLVLPFHSGARGSSIIMTTRKDQLLKKLGFDRLDDLERLSDKDALSLLSIHALGANNFDSHPTLKEKGEGIVEKCGRLPLALKAIGRLLRTKTDGEDWDAVLESDIWDLESVDEIVPALKLSYRDLSADLKWLFAYCSLFPKDFLFNKEELVLLWMAEGYLNQSGANKSQECLGDECFEKLLSRSFFQHAPHDKSLFVMHDLMNDLAVFVARDYFLRFDNHMDAGKKTLAKYRHMSFIQEEYVAYNKFEALKRAKSLRTFLAVNDGVDQRWKTFYLSNKILIDLLLEFPMLRVLCLSHFAIRKVPVFVGNLKHLRYLNLSKTGIKELPENIGNLYNLQTLIIFGCKSLTKLPKSLLKLTKLRYLDIRNTPRLKKLPLGIGGLRSLQTLSKFIIGGDGGFGITELKRLENLHGEISIEGLHKVQSPMHAREANLSLKRLTKLTLKWDDDFHRGTLDSEVLDDKVLDVLKPDSDRLKMLNIVSYRGIMFPNWVGDPTFHQLVHVLIYGCRKCKFLPPLGRLPSLKKLFIQHMHEVEVIDSEFTGTTGIAFPSLEILSFEGMLEWKVWSTNKEVLDVVFPCLRELHIINCPKLIDLSLVALPLLNVLKIEGCGDSVLKSLVWAASSITKLFLRSISCLTDKVWRGVIKNLGAVEELRIYECNLIRYLWELEAKESMILVNLKSLYVRSCYNLVSLGDKEEENNFRSNLLSSLRVMEIMGCNNMEHCCCPNNIESLSIISCYSITRVSFPTTKGGGGQKLKSLQIYGCGKLMKKINNTSMPMLKEVHINGWINLKSLIQFGNLIHLTIEYCPSLESFPDTHMSNLTRLIIIDCQSMTSFPNIQLPTLTHLEIQDCKSLEPFQLSHLTSLKDLKIRNCNASIYSGLWPPKLSSLVIGELKKPISDWGPQNFPNSLVDLTLFGEPHVSNFSQLSGLFPGSLRKLSILLFDNLESLSMGLQHLISLQHLKIYGCPKMKHLPKTLLPSLFSLDIHRCPHLSRRCNGRCSHYWPLISHIHHISLDTD